MKIHQKVTENNEAHGTAQARHKDLRRHTRRSDAAHTARGDMITKEAIKETFGGRLFRLRERWGLTMRELAEELDLSQSTLSYLESGRNPPSVLTVCLVADYFRVTTDYLLRGKK